jgi:hypothetical protein
VANDNVQSAWTTLQTFAALYISFATETGAPLPFATLQDFEVFGHGSRSIAGLDAIVYAPLLTNTTMRQQWTSYSQLHQQWIVRGNAMDPTIDLSLVQPILPELWTWNDEGDPIVDPSAAPYSPMWQISPPPLHDSMVNYNLQSDPTIAQYLRHATRNAQTGLSPPYMDVQPLLLPSPSSTNSSSTMDSTKTVSSRNATHVVSLMVLPVFRSFDSTTILQAKVIGHLLASLPWSTIFRNTSKQDQHDVHVVVVSCGVRTLGVLVSHWILWAK